MKIASVSEAKNRLSALIDSLRSGSPVLIVDRGRPVARLEPVDAVDDLTQAEQEGRLARLVRSGVVRAGRGRLPPGFFAEPIPQPKDSVSVVDALLEERRDGR